MEQKEKIEKIEKIEDIILRHSRRSMDILRHYMPEDYCLEAAKDILSWEKGTIFLTTGFYVAGHAETDGPAGTVVLAEAVKKLGYHPVIVTDHFCKGFFEIRGLAVEYMPLEEEMGEGFCKQILKKHHPVGLISIERCGRNVKEDYTNMRGISIKEHTAAIDMLFEMTDGIIPSIGVGDGGNEIGMGNMANIIAEKLLLIPSKTRVDRLVIACVSNWGAYAITAYLEKLTKIKLLPDFEEIRSYIEETVKIGSVDGVTHEPNVTVDGYDIAVEKEIVESLHEAVRA